MGYAPEVEDDDTLDEDGQPTPAPPPTEPITSSMVGADPKTLLYQELARKLSNQQKASATAPLIQTQRNTSDTLDRNALYTALAQSAGQIGTLHGVAASAGPVNEAANRMDQAAVMGQQGVQQEVGREQQDREALYRYLAQQSNIEFQRARFNETQDYHKGMLGLRDRALSDREGQQKPGKFTPAGVDPQGNMLILDNQTGKLTNSGQTANRIDRRQPIQAADSGSSDTGSDIGQPSPASSSAVSPPHDMTWAQSHAYSPDASIAGEAQGILNPSPDAQESARESAQKPSQKSDPTPSPKEQAEMTKMGHEMVGGTASSRSDFGRNQATMTNAGKITALAQQAQMQKGGLTPGQMHELTISTAALVGGGTPAESSIRAMVPETSSGSWASLEQWLSNEPRGAGQQAFVNQMMETAEREGYNANENLNAIKGDIAYSHAGLKKFGNWWQGQLNHFMGPQAQFDQYGRYQRQQYSSPAGAANPAQQGAAAMPMGATKVVNGTTYQKVQGGWKAVP